VTETIVWVCLAFSILAADLILEWQQPGRPRSVFYHGEPLSIPAMGGGGVGPKMIEKRVVEKSLR